MEKQSNQNDQTNFSVPMEQKKEGDGNEVKKRYSVLGVVAAFLLVIILIMFGERLIFDANRILNPVVERDYTNWKNNFGYGNNSAEAPFVSEKMEMAVDISGGPGSSVKVYYPKAEEGRYLMYKLIIHASIIIPLFVLIFGLFYFKKENYSWRPIVIGFLLAGFWLIIHLLGETMNFVMDAYKNIAIYIILIILALLFGVFTFYSQSRYLNKKS